jgi:hypothetical protein
VEHSKDKTIYIVVLAKAFANNHQNTAKYVLGK